VTVRNYGPTAQGVTPTDASKVSVTYPDGTVPTFSTPVAVTSGDVSFAIDDGGSPPLHVLIVVQNTPDGSKSTARATLGPDGTSPTAVVGAAAGTAPSAVTVSGRDDDGTVSLTVGTATAAGHLVTVTFAQAKAAAPSGIVLTPGGDNSAAAQLEVRNITAAGFDVYVKNAPTASTAFVFDYAYVPAGAGV
jgi:hypothetical protein